MNAFEEAFIDKGISNGEKRGFEASKEIRLKMLGEIFNLKGKIVEEEVEIVDGFEIWSMHRFDAGKEEERKQILHNIAEKLIKQSKSKGKILSEAEALKQAEALIS